MTTDQMNRDRDDLATYLSCTRLTVRRAEHKSVTESALLVFDGERQIASVSKTGAKARLWRASMMAGPSRVSSLSFWTLLKAAAYVFAAWGPNGKRAMLNSPILETITRESSTYERRTEWSSSGYAYVTMHNTDSGHGWGGRMSLTDWDDLKNPARQSNSRALPQYCTAGRP